MLFRVTRSVSFLLALVLGTLGATSLGPPGGRLAYACSLGAYPDTQSQLKAEFAKADAVVLAQVGTPATFVYREAGGYERADAQKVSITPAYVLKGSIDSDQSVGPFGFLSPTSCIGGGELNPGEHVLLFLRQSLVDDVTWAVQSPVVIFANGHAYDRQPLQDQVSIGSGLGIAAIALELGSVAVPENEVQDFVGVGSETSPIVPPSTGSGGLMPRLN